MADSAGHNKTPGPGEPASDPPKEAVMDESDKNESDPVPTPDTAPSSQESAESKMEVDEPTEDAATKEEEPAPLAVVQEPPKVEPEPEQQEVKVDVLEKPKVIIESECSEKDIEENGCYCGVPRRVGTLELLCGICFKFFHAECVSCYLGKIVPFMMNYQFFCKRCNMSGIESFNKKQATFGQMCQTTLANLLSQNPDQTYFSKDREIIPYIEKNWECLTTTPRRIKLTWHTTIVKTMVKEIDTFICNEEDPTDVKFALFNTELERIGPNYEAMFKAPTTLYRSDFKVGTFDVKEVPSQTKTRGTKRKLPGDTFQTSYGMKPKKGEVMSTRVAPNGYPTEHPHNKDGYRYILAEPDPHAPNRDAFDASLEWAGKPIPGYLYRTWLSSQVLMALHDRAPQLKLSDDRLSILSGEKGYCMVRATHGVSRGSWYYEVTVSAMPEDAATRIGWAQQLGNLQAPCGYDKFSYSWRSRKGTSFHQSRGKHYCEEGYKEGDVLGFFISIPDPEDPHKILPKTSKDKPLVKFKSHLYFEEKDYVTETEKNLQSIKGSKLVMYRNGECMGTAFEDIFDGTYYPAVSVYRNASIVMNFGPDFKFPPKDAECLAMSEAAHVAVVEHALADILYHVEHEGRLPEFS